MVRFKGRCIRVVSVIVIATLRPSFAGWMYLVLMSMIESEQGIVKSRCVCDYFGTNTHSEF